MAERFGLFINTAAVSHSSRGVQRYFARVMRHLDWPGPIASLEQGRLSWDRVRELFHPGRHDAVFWTPCQRIALCARHHVLTIHDCINVEYTHARDWRLPLYRRLSNVALVNAAAVVAISEATKAALLRNYDLDTNHITVIRSGDDVFSHARDSALPARRRQQDERFALMVINALPHKNGLAACKAFAASRAKKNRLSLRIAGFLPETALDLLNRGGIHFELQRSVDEATLFSWYATCQFLLSPSLEEGHNLVVAEALAARANVLCSDIPVHREYYDGRVRFFDPKCHDSMVTAIDTAIDSPSPWVVAKGCFPSRSFADVALDYTALFNEIAAGIPRIQAPTITS